MGIDILGIHIKGVDILGIDISAPTLYHILQVLKIVLETKIMDTY